MIYPYKRVISKIFRRMDFSLLFPLKEYNRNLAKIKVNKLRLIIIANNLQRLIIANNLQRLIIVNNLQKLIIIVNNLDSNIQSNIQEI